MHASNALLSAFALQASSGFWPQVVSFCMHVSHASPCCGSLPAQSEFAHCVWHAPGDWHMHERYTSSPAFEPPLCASSQHCPQSAAVVLAAQA
jgi:hypothetical protein